MSTLERRLQILLDQERYAKVEAEAVRSGRSVAAVIREAIDVRFSPAAADRAEAAAAFLAATADPGGPGEDWAATKSAMDDDLSAALPSMPRPPSPPGSRRSCPPTGASTPPRA